MISASHWPTPRCGDAFSISTRGLQEFFSLSILVGIYENVWVERNQKQMVKKPNAYILHPGPINRGVEIDSELADSGKSRDIGSGKKWYSGSDVHSVPIA